MGTGCDVVVASVLRKSWYPAPQVYSGAVAELETAAPTLLATGAAGLAWWRLSHSGSAPAPLNVLDELHQAYRLHSLQSALHVRSIRALIPPLQAAGLSPLLVKGWAAARNYPDPALRPYGDIDLCVSDVDHATRVLAAGELREFNVDLHQGGEHLIDVPFDEVIAQSQLIDLDGVMVRIPSDEHHLRILCLHLLYHGAWRPLWLCDIGAALDAASDSFDWDAFLGRDPIRVGWMTCTLRLAESLLGADLSRAPESVRSAVLPSWIKRSVLREWTRSHRWTSARPLGETMANRPWAAPREIVRRWPDPIRASVAYGAPFDRGWRAPYQLRYSLARIGTVIGQLRDSGRR